ncbi:MAG: hypothetical protein K2G67_02050 [Muribaculaceae bacterium]|nr:hypothetical protein [Muribaculaceae bacterium]
MKFYYRMLIAIFMVMASVTNLAAQYDCLYLVGNVSSWNSPSQSNADFYQNYKLQSDGDFLGSPILKGSFDVSSLGDAPMFRFYSALEGWEQNSYGSQYQDMPVDFSLSAMQTGQKLTEGKGSFNITDWTGNILYITVWNGLVWASNSGCYDPTVIPVINDLDAMTPCDGDPGIYSANFVGNTGNIKVKGSVVGHPESEWLYIAPKKDLVPDEYGIVVLDFDYSESPVNFEYVYSGFGTPSFMTYVDLYNKKLYCNNKYSKWLTGSINDCPKITFDNYKNYDQYLLSSYTRNYLLTDVPAGQVKVIYDTPSFGKSYQDFKSWNVDRDLYCNTLFDAFFDVNWPGGTLFAENSVMGYIKSLDEMYLWTLEEDMTPILLQPKSSGIFEGVVSLPAGMLENGIKVLFQDKTLQAPGIDVYNGMNNSFFNDQKTTIELDYLISGNAPYALLNQFPYGAQIKVSVNRNDNTLSFTVVDGEIQNVPIMKWVDAGDREQSGEWLFKRYDNKTFINTMVSISLESIQSTEWHIGMSDGSIVVPNWNAGVSEGYGMTRYPVTLIKSNEIPEDAILSVSAPFYKWYDLTAFQFNVESQEFIVYQSNDALSEITVEDGFKLPKCLYLYGLVYNPEVNNQVNAMTGGQRWFNLNNTRDNILPLVYDSDNKCGVYEGKFSLKNQPSDWTIINIGILPALLSDNPAVGVDVMEDNLMYPIEHDIFQKNAIVTYSTSTFDVYTKDAPSEDYTVRVYIYGPDNVKIWVGNGAATIKEIELTDLDALQIIGLKGAIRMESLTPVDISVYSVNGSLVRKTKIQAGSTTLDGFHPGVYIVNGKKVFVL